MLDTDLRKRMLELGLGDDPNVSRRTYLMVERVVRAYGDRALFVVHDLLDYAAYKREPGHWFRMVVGDRLKQHGFDVRSPHRSVRNVEKVKHIAQKVAGCSLEEQIFNTTPRPIDRRQELEREMEAKKARLREAFAGDRPAPVN